MNKSDLFRRRHEQHELADQFVSVVSYVQDTSDQVSLFLDQVMSYVQQLFQHTELILVFNSNRKDLDQNLHDYFRDHIPDYMVSLVKVDAGQGAEAAMNAGRDLSIGDFVLEFDDQCVDYGLDVIQEAMQRCLEGNDIVSVGCKGKKRASSQLFYRVFNRFSRSHNRIGSVTFCLLTRRAINRIQSMGEFIPYRKAVYSNCGLQIYDLEYDPVRESDKLAHSHPGERVSLAMDTFVYFTNFFERVSLAICVIFFIIAIAVVIYVIVSFFTDANLVSGWVSMMGFLSLAFMGVFGLLTIVLKYLSVLVNLSYRRQGYLIEGVEKISEK